MWDRVPATFVVRGSQWEDDASQDYGDNWNSMPAHAQHWASQVCTLGTAIQNHVNLAAAIQALGFSPDAAIMWSTTYHCLRRRTRNLEEIDAC
jgi:hypothetical protein